MKSAIFKIPIIALITLMSCNENVSESKGQSNVVEKELLLIPIHYDFDNLKLTLNASISDPAFRDFWRWDYMNSDNGGPDSTGIDYFMNHSQPVFSYNGGETLPSLSIKTNKNKIIEFSVTTIFGLGDTAVQNLQKVLDELIKYELLKKEEIKNQITKSHYYQHSDANFSEELRFEFSDSQIGYSRLTYKITTIQHHLNAIIASKGQQHGLARCSHN